VCVAQFGLFWLDLFEMAQWLAAVFAGSFKLRRRLSDRSGSASQQDYEILSAIVRLSCRLRNLAGRSALTQNLLTKM
jgi:hypothetical protein